jgi:hypothetical protein
MRPGHPNYRKIPLMKTHVACTLVLMITSLARAETPALQTFSAPCSAVEATALPFLSARSLVLLPQPNCPGCFIGKTSDLHDAANKKVSTTHALHAYMEPIKRKSNPLAWYAHSSMDTVAHLTFLDVGSTCQTSLIFHYGWYGAQFIVIMPVDGDPESRPSNLRLEKEYLDEMAKHISSH